MDRNLPTTESLSQWRGSRGSSTSTHSRCGRCNLSARVHIRRVARKIMVQTNPVALLKYVNALDFDEVQAFNGVLSHDDVLEVTTNVGPLWLDKSDRIITPLIEEYRTWELDVSAFLERYLSPGMTFVDVGANV